MADLSFLRDTYKPIAVLGLGVSGLAVAEALHQAGVPFHAWDDTAERRADAKARFPVVDITQNLDDYAFMVPAAGIKPSHPVMQAATSIHLPIFSDVDLLLLSAPDATVIGVTGTNGKSTTTALIDHVLRHAGVSVAMGGNIGIPACSLPSLQAGGVYILELSSYMLEISANPVADIAVLLNITPDHLDWHGTMENYVAAKEKIFRQRLNHAPQVRVYGQSMPQNMGKMPLIVQPFLKGEHNAENIAATIAACRAVGLDDETILRHLQTFEGLAHRQKQVATIGSVTFINDSKATNTDSAAKALETFDNIYWLVGGMATDDKLNGLDRYFSKIHKAYLIGQASDEFAEILSGKLAFEECGTVKNAVAAAYSDAKNDVKPATVLLATACKSWDQYKNFEQRGDDFVAQVRLLETGDVSC